MRHLRFIKFPVVAFASCSDQYTSDLVLVGIFS